MPANLIKAISKECRISKDKLEELWDKAKKAVAGTEHENDYQYITGIFKRILKAKYPKCYKKYFKESIGGVRMKIKILTEELQAPKGIDVKELFEILRSCNCEDKSDVIYEIEKYFENKGYYLEDWADIGMLACVEKEKDDMGYVEAVWVGWCYGNPDKPNTVTAGWWKNRTYCSENSFGPCPDPLEAWNEWEVVEVSKDKNGGIKVEIDSSF